MFRFSLTAIKILPSVWVLIWINVQSKAMKLLLIVFANIFLIIYRWFDYLIILKNIFKKFNYFFILRHFKNMHWKNEVLKYVQIELFILNLLCLDTN